MTPEDYLPLIAQKYPNEDPNDVAKMLEILAEARAAAKGETLSADHFQFAGKIICIIFDPVKATNPDFSRQTKSLRRAYKGIANSADFQEMFRGSLRPELLSAEEVSEAIEAGVETLFWLPAVVDDNGGSDDEG